jgi:peptidoglycan/xylan/chitin deacetylase (PgdA/CDA1 family)
MTGGESIVLAAATRDTDGMAHWLRRYLLQLAFGVCAATALPAAPAISASSAVLIMYHRFGEDSLPSTNIRIEQFEAQIEVLASGGYSVLPLPDIIAALRTGAPLPDKTIGITIDDANSSVYEQAWPRLKAAGFPFTVFVSTDPVDAGVHGVMSWDQLRELADSGVTIGHHSASHAHMAGRDEALNTADIAKASERFRAELGRTPELFAYPYGEYSRALQELIADQGFTAAFGQHSGVAHEGEFIFALPRFALNESYGDIDRFKMISRTLALPVSDVTPSDSLLGPNPPLIGFTVDESLERLDQLNCFASGQGAAEIERLGERRIEVRLKAPFPPGRSRLNCTIPGREGRFHWFGMQFLTPTP